MTDALKDHSRLLAGLIGGGLVMAWLLAGYFMAAKSVEARFTVRYG